MLYILKGELIKTGNKNPVKAIMGTIQCSEKTARNKLSGVTSFTVPEAVQIQETFFSESDHKLSWLFQNDKTLA